MLYKLNSADSLFDKLEAVPFKDFSAFGKQEKELEELIAYNLLDVLFEDSRLMPVFQERQYQAEADIYALNEKGELIIFELKRSTASGDAVQQALRYAQDAGQWSFSTLQGKYRQYTNSNDCLLQAHKDAFELEKALDVKGINLKQHILIIGSAVDDNLINAVEYWSAQGLSIQFLPYRIYEIGADKYFEFFTLPYDRHRNPGDIKGVLFDTNRSWDENTIWYMMENNRVAAFGDAKRFIEHVHPGDIVFFSHRWEGIVAAARVKLGGVKVADDGAEHYRDVEFITPIPKKDQPLKAMTFSKVSEVTGKSFFWARTIKVPYLSKNEAENLIKELMVNL